MYFSCLPRFPPPHCRRRQELLARTHRRVWGLTWSWERWLLRGPPPGPAAGDDGGGGGGGDCLLDCLECSREGALG